MPNGMAALLYTCTPTTYVGLIGFDCSVHGFNITIFSLLDIGDGELAEIELALKKPMYNFNNYQATTGLESSWTRVQDGS